MKNVVCIKWGTLYGAEYVNTLYAMIKRNLTPPFRFICITDNNSGIHPIVETKPFVGASMKGWWTKVSLFQDPLYDISGNILFVDLDMVIVDNIDCFFEYPGEFVAKWDYGHHGGMSSCVMRFPSGRFPHVYENLDLNKIDHATNNLKANFKQHKYWGDQIWISEQMQNHGISLWPREWNAKFGLDCHWDPTLHKQFSEIGRPNRTGPGYFKVPTGTKIISFAGPNQRHEKELLKIGKWWHAADIDK